MSTGAGDTTQQSDAAIHSPALCGCAACGASTGFTSGSVIADPNYVLGAPGSIDPLLNQGSVNYWNGGSVGTGATITFAFMTSIPQRYYNLEPYANAEGFSILADFAGRTSFSSAQQAAVRGIMDMYESVCNLTINEVSYNSNSAASIEFTNATMDPGVGGFAYYPNQSFAGNKYGGDVFIANSNTGTSLGSWGYLTLLHEIGHALGLKHPGNYNAGGGGTEGPYLPTGQDSHRYTVMSYYDHPSYPNTSPITPMLLDIAALQYIYGANTSYNSGANTYTVANYFGANEMKCLWDGGGTDTIDLSSLSVANWINLNAGEFSSINTGGVQTNNFSIAYNASIENATGGSGADTITGNALANVLSGGAGNDTINGGHGDDTLIGGAGADYLHGGDTGYDTVSYATSTTGISFNFLNASSSTGDATGDSYMNVERVIGTDFADTFYGGTTLHLVGGAGIDTLDFSLVAGGTAYLDSGDITGIEIVIGSAYADTFIGDANANTLLGNGGNDYLRGGGGDDILNGGDGNDDLRGGAGADQLNGGNGTDLLDYSTSTSAVTVNLATNAVSGGDATGDTISSFESIKGTIYADTLTGDAGDNVIDGNGGGDTVEGGGGADWIVNATYASYANSSSGVFVSLVTGTGSGGDAEGDTLTSTFNLIGSAFDDTFVSSGMPNSLSGGAGSDTVSYASSYAAVNVNLVTNAASGGLAVGDTLISIENLIGSSYADTLTGDGNDNIITGGMGADTLNGGAGNDTVSYAGSFGGVVVYLNTNTVSGGYGTGDVISNFENIIGSGYDDTLGGDHTDNVLEGGVGADVMVGNAGNDTASYASSSAGVSVNMYTGTLSGGDAAGDTLINMENLLGSAYVDALTGNSVANVLSGGWGNDTLAGREGADTLSGGEGNDSLDGGMGADILRGDAGLDLLYGMSGADTLEGGAGNDTLMGGADDDTLRGGDGNDAYLFGYGDGIDLIEDSSGTDVIRMGAGITSIDVIMQQFGNDLYVSLRDDSNHALLSVDRMLIKDFYTSTTNRIESLQFADGSSVDLGAASVINGGAGAETISAGWGNDWLLGGGGDDTLNSDAGNDVLDGGTGNDTLNGGAGDDAYVLGRNSAVDTLTDTSGTDDSVTFSAGITAWDVMMQQWGNDLYISLRDGNNHALMSVDRFLVKDYYSASNRMEKLRFVDGTTIDISGASVINGGNTAETISSGWGNDWLLGNGGADTLSGNDGNDTLDGGTGNDMLNGGQGNDLYAFYAGTGFDTVTEGATGSPNSDTLSFGAGITAWDIMFNQSGNNLYVGLYDGVASSADSATDRILLTDWYLASNKVEFFSFADGLRVDLTNASMINGSSGAETLTGGSGVDWIRGNAGNDTINGNGGNDLLAGGAGTDTLTGGTGADAYLFGRGDGADTVVENDDTIGVEDSLLFGANITADQLWFSQSGNHLDVAIIGTNDRVTLQNWFLGSEYRVERFKVADGDQLLEGQVQALVTAMAGYTAPAFGTTTLSDPSYDPLETVIAAAWR